MTPRKHTLPTVFDYLAAGHGSRDLPRWQGNGKPRRRRLSSRLLASREQMHAAHGRWQVLRSRAARAACVPVPGGRYATRSELGMTRGGDGWTTASDSTMAGGLLGIAPAGVDRDRSFGFPSTGARHGMATTNWRPARSGAGANRLRVERLSARPRTVADDAGGVCAWSDGGNRLALVGTPAGRPGRLPVLSGAESGNGQRGAPQRAQRDGSSGWSEAWRRQSRSVSGLFSGGVRSL